MEQPFLTKNKKSEIETEIVADTGVRFKPGVRKFCRKKPVSATPEPEPEPENPKQNFEVAFMALLRNLGCQLLAILFIGFVEKKLFVVCHKKTKTGEIFLT